MFIRNEKRFNPYVAHQINGTNFYPGYFIKHPEKREENGISEIADPIRESDETHYVQEINEFPYIINTPKPVESVQNVVWQKIKSHRDRLTESGGYMVDGKWYHSDTGSKVLQIGLVMMGSNIPANLQWKTMDGSFVTMTSALANLVFGAAAIQATSIFAVAEQHRLNIMALTDVNDIAEYDWKTGWPEVYEDTIQQTP